MKWINEIEFEDLLEKDAELIYRHCGLETLVSLWQNLPGITLYLSEKNLFDMKRRYVRTCYERCSKKGIPFDAKRVAVKISVSERFVYDALATTDEKDDRQQSLL